MTDTSLGFQRATTVSEIAGSLNLKVARQGDRSGPALAEFNGVLRLMKPLYFDDSGQVVYIIVNPGGGYFGERYRMDVEVGEGANLLLTSQGATRIYRTPTEPASQDSQFVLKAGSRLEYVPDQTIAYRDADYRQRTRITAAPDAQAFIGEVVTPGWDPNSERFTYASMHLRIDVQPESGTGMVCMDNVRIQPSELGESIEGIGYMEGHSHMGSVLILGPHTDGDYADQVRETVDAVLPGKVGVTSGKRHGVSWLMVRALANSTDALNAMILSVNELDRSITTGQSRLHLRRY